MTHSGSKTSAPGAFVTIALALCILAMSSPLGLAYAQGDAAGAGETRGPKAWTSYVSRTGVSATPQAQAEMPVTASQSQNPYLLASMAFLLAGVAGAAGYYGARSRMGAEVAQAVSKLGLPQAPAQAPAPVQLPRYPIELRAAERIEGYGTVLVVETDGDFLVLYVDGAKGAASFLCRLSDAPALGWRLEEIISGVVTAIRQGSPREAALAATRAISRDGQHRGEGGASAPGQDEDLDVLLDELLGKVRGLKPAVKSDHDL